MQTFQMPANIDEHREYKKSQAWFLDPRIFVVIVGYAFFFSMIFLILARAGNLSQSDMRAKLAQYHSVVIYENTHTPGAEIDMTHLTSGKNKLVDCIMLCEQRRESGCNAVNYYTPEVTKDGSTQCWLLASIPEDRIETFTGITLVTLDANMVPNKLNAKH